MATLGFVAHGLCEQNITNQNLKNRPTQGISQESGRQLLTWWRHQMETFPALLALCAGNSPVADESPSQSPVTRSFDIFFGLRLNGCANNRYAGDFSHNRAHYDVTVMSILHLMIMQYIPRNFHPVRAPMCLVVVRYSLILPLSTGTTSLALW